MYQSLLLGNVVITIGGLSVGAFGYQSLLLGNVVVNIGSKCTWQNVSIPNIR